MSAVARFRQEDLTRAVRGVEKAGLRVGRVEIAPDGKIVILPASEALRAPNNPWNDDL